MHSTGSNGAVSYSAQGNIASTNTKPRLVRSFRNCSGCNLAERLYRALISVDEINTNAKQVNAADSGSKFEGGVRCEAGSPFMATNGFPGLQAYAHFEDNAGNILMHLEYITQSTRSSAWTQFASTMPTLRPTRLTN